MVMEMSKTYQYRKVMKPLLERKRRARINKCLDELKDLMVECLQQEGEHVTRLEKADILELTVEHMKKLRAQKQLRLSNLMGLADQRSETKLSIAESFHAGYVHAADQITQVLIQQQQHDEVGGKIMKFLSLRLGEMQQQQQQQHATSAVATAAAAAAALRLDFLPAAALMMPLTTTAHSALTSATAGTACGDRAVRAVATATMTSSSARQDNELQIDVTTVENLDATSCDSLDSSASSDAELVWRPW